MLVSEFCDKIINISKIRADKYFERATSKDFIYGIIGYVDDIEVNILYDELPIEIPNDAMNIIKLAKIITSKYSNMFVRTAIVNCEKIKNMKIIILDSYDNHISFVIDNNKKLKIGSTKIVAGGYPETFKNIIQTITKFILQNGYEIDNEEEIQLILEMLSKIPKAQEPYTGTILL